jgi:GT2 family glycosyltransferase
MKILYTKNNSERNQAFQLRTIIYEEDGRKYVKKEAITQASMPHLEKMKENYTRLSESIIDPKIKLAPIIAEDEKSLTFEFIEGVSFEKQFEAVSEDPSELKKLLQKYLSVLEEGFRTTQFDHRTMVNSEMERIFGSHPYEELDGERCYDGICNLDMIFSNLIEKEGELYLIDYEWAYALSLPVSYILYRTALMLPEAYRTQLVDTPHTLLYHKMERHFIDAYVMQDSFYFQKNRYMKVQLPVVKTIEEKEIHVKQLEAHIRALTEQLDSVGEELSYARSVVELRDRQIEALRLKNRIKRAVKKFLPWKSAEGEEAIPQEPRRKYTYHTPQFDASHKEILDTFKKRPLISIIMPVYNIDPKWLDKAIKSIEAQWYENWELCIADDKSTNVETITYLKAIDDPRIKIKFLEENLNISGASNAALEMAEGEYIALMDNDDESTPDALYEMVKVINREDADLIYSDEDFIDTEGICSNPHFKPDFSPDLLLSHNYMTHFTCFKRSLLEKVGPFNSKYDGSQDYDLFLRLTEKTSNIHHIPKVLYHWRMLEGSTSANSEAKPEALDRGRFVLQDTLMRRGIEGTVEHANMHHYFRVRYHIKHNPLVSIIIPFKDKPELLEMSVGSILKRSTYQNYEIIGISNNSEEPATFDMMAYLEKQDARVKFYEYNTEFNYADINNHAVNTYAKGEHLLLLNNDIEVISPSWMEAMLEHSQRDEVGCVGAKLYYPDDTVQHAGIIIGLGGYAGHSHKMYPRNNPGYFNRLMVVQNVSAVTAACLMVKKEIYQKVGGMDAENFKVAYNDVDFCLRVRREGYLNIFTPYAEMYHHESISRGYETTPEKVARFQQEKDALFARHGDMLTQGDPYYNPNLCHDKEDFSICPK